MRYFDEKEVETLKEIKQGYKTRIVESGGEICIDIREHIDSVNFKGFTKRGLRLKKNEVKRAIEVLGEALEKI